MIKKLSKKMTSFFVAKKYIEKAEQEVYDFCFEIFLSTILNLLALIIIAICTKKIIETSMFVFAFMIMRQTMGGYHAKSHLGCLIFLMLVYSGLVVSLFYYKEKVMFILSTVFNFIACTLILLFSPVENVNRELTKKEKKRNRKKSFAILALMEICISVLLSFDVTRYFGYVLSYTTYVVAVSMLLGFLKNIYEKRQLAKAPCVNDNTKNDIKHSNSA